GPAPVDWPASPLTLSPAPEPSTGPGLQSSGSTTTKVAGRYGSPDHPVQRRPSQPVQWTAPIPPMTTHPTPPAHHRIRNQATDGLREPLTSAPSEAPLLASMITDTFRPRIEPKSVHEQGCGAGTRATAP